MKLLLATNHPVIDSIMEKLESQAGIIALEKDLKEDRLSKWAKPITIIDEAKYRESLMEKARAARPDIILLYDKLPGAIDLGLLLEEIRLEIRNNEDKDTRVIFLTSLEQGSTLLRKAVEIGIWDIISGKDIKPIDIINRIYEPGNYSDVAHFKLAADTKSQVKYVPRYIEKEKLIEVPVEREVKITKIVKEKEYVRVGNAKGIKETVLIWSPHETGKTFLAVNTAVALSKKGLRTILTDTDLTNRSLQSFFVMEKEERYTFLKSLKERSDAETVLDRAFKYKKNLYVLPLPGGAAEMPKADSEEFSLLYDSLRRESDIFVIDGDKDIESPLTKTALKLASRVILPVTQDLNRARAIRVKLKELSNQGIPLNKFEPILNMAVTGGGPGRAEIEDILEMKLLKIEIPAVLDAAYRSISDGIPAYDDKHTPELFAFCIDMLAAYINGDENTSQRKPKKLFGLFG